MSKAQERAKWDRIKGRQALEDAARSLRTAADWRKRQDRTLEELWPWLESRARVAEETLESLTGSVAEEP